LDALKTCDKASFCVYDHGYRREGEWALNVRSVIAFGRIHVIDDKDELISALSLLGERYNPGHPSDCIAEINKFINNVCVLCLEIEHMTGKAARELIKKP